MLMEMQTQVKMELSLEAQDFSEKNHRRSYLWFWR